MRSCYDLFNEQHRSFLLAMQSWQRVIAFSLQRDDQMQVSILFYYTLWDTFRCTVPYYGHYFYYICPSIATSCNSFLTSTASYINRRLFTTVKGYKCAPDTAFFQTNTTEAFWLACSHARESSLSLGADDQMQGPTAFCCTLSHWSSRHVVRTIIQIYAHLYSKLLSLRPTPAWLLQQHS